MTTIRPHTKGKEMKHAIFLVAAIATTSVSVCAGTYTWTGTNSSTWDVATVNWNDGSANVVWADGKDAVFANTSSRDITVSGARTAVNITTSGDNHYFRNSGTLSWTGLFTANAFTYIYAPLADFDNGLHFKCNAHIFLEGANAHTGGTYIDGGNNKALGLDSGDAALGTEPPTSQDNIFFTGKGGVLFVPINRNVVTHQNRNIHIAANANAMLAAQGTLRVKGRINGEVTDYSLGLPTTTRLYATGPEVNANWVNRVTLDPGEGRTNYVGRLQVFGNLEIASGVTYLSCDGNNSIGENALGYIGGNSSTAYNSNYGHLTLSGGELYADQSSRRINAGWCAIVDIVGGKFNMPNVEYMNGLSPEGNGTSPATLNVGDGGEFIVNELRLSQSRGAGGVVNLKTNGIMRVNYMRMDSDYVAYFNFNGGTLESRSESGNFFGRAPSHSDYNKWANVKCRILEGGAVFDGSNRWLFMRMPLESGVASGKTDGGVKVVGGNKGVVFYVSNTYTGPTRLERDTQMQVRTLLNGLPTGTTLQLAKGSKIDFNMRNDEPANTPTTQTVARVEGVGRIFNNQEFRVTGGIAPVFDGEYGTLTNQWPCALVGDFEIKGDANGCGSLWFEQPGQDISNLTIKMVNPEDFSHHATKTTYRILHAPGVGFTGHFKDDDKLGNWRVTYTANDAYLTFIKGTALTLR